MARGNVVVKLRDRRRDQAVVEQLEALLDEARAGKIVGLVAGVHYGGAEYAYIGSGSLVENPDLGIATAVRLCNKFT